MLGRLTVRWGTMLFSGRWSCITSSYVFLADPGDADDGREREGQI